MDTVLIKDKIINIINNNHSIETKLQEICNFLKEKINYYDWVGFYFKNGDKQELKLAKFAGEPTEHTIIPFGKGFCGQVAVTNKNFVVQDVSEQTNDPRASEKLFSDETTICSSIFLIWISVSKRSV